LHSLRSAGDSFGAGAEKAVRAVSPVVSALSGKRSAVEVVSLDCPRDLVRRVTDTLDEPEEGLKRLFESKDDRDAALKLRSTLLSLRNKHPFVYNYREEWLMMVTI
jgi:hypothetical protein